MAPQLSKQQQILDSLTEIRHSIDLHVQKDTDRDKKTDRMYEILVTGNGKPSMEVRVSKIEAWIEGERKFLWILLTTIVGLFGSGLLWLIKTVIELQSLLETVK